MILHILDGTTDFQGWGLPDNLSQKTILTVINKVDLIPNKPINLLSISAKTGIGISELWEQIKYILRRDFGSHGKAQITRERYRVALHDCICHLQHSLSVCELELKAEDLRLAARSLGRITGRIDAEDLLDVIFRDFCIGK